MTTQVFEVENIKCGGCMNTIRKGLESIAGVKSAQPDNTTGTVGVEYDEAQVEPTTITDKLKEMGYPAMGENHLGLKAKSYVSCMIGRMTDDQGK